MRKGDIVFIGRNIYHGVGNFGIFEKYYMRGVMARVKNLNWSCIDTELGFYVSELTLVNNLSKLLWGFNEE